MKILTWLFILSCVYKGAVYGQDSIYAKGAYTTINELRQHTPAINPEFTIMKRSAELIRKFGGNNYNIYITGDSASVKKIWRKYYAVSSGDTLYLNCRKLGIGIGFTNVLAAGRYLAFKAYLPQRQIDNDAVAYGVLFGIINGAAYQALKGPYSGAVQFPFLWTIDMNTGKTAVLTYGGMLKLLEPYKELKQIFINEPEKDSEDMLLLYVKKLNAL